MIRRIFLAASVIKNARLIRIFGPGDQYRPDSGGGGSNYVLLRITDVHHVARREAGLFQGDPEYTRIGLFYAHLA